MAENDDDYRPGFDFTVAVVNGTPKLHLESVRPAIHRGTEPGGGSIDETCPSAITGSDLLTLRTTTSQATFDSVLASYWSAWTGYASRWGAGMRLAVQAPSWPT